MLILSIDHSFSRTGYSLLDDYKLLATGSFFGLVKGAVKDE